LGQHRIDLSDFRVHGFKQVAAVLNGEEFPFSEHIAEC
jgi:hypothetical protein